MVFGKSSGWVHAKQCGRLVDVLFVFDMGRGFVTLVKVHFEIDSTQGRHPGLVTTGFGMLGNLVLKTSQRTVVFFEGCCVGSGSTPTVDRNNVDIAHGIGLEGGTKMMACDECRDRDNVIHATFAGPTYLFCVVDVSIR